MGFAKNFAWGTATCAYQIEGSAYADGKGLNIWDTFCKEKGKIVDGSSGDTACNHYLDFEKDVELMAAMGVNSYRFSISWARLLPDGTGRVNQAGIDFYNRLIDCLLAHNVTPYATLYHWDLPYELHKKGGWLNPESPKWFEEYAELVAKSFSDRVTNFMTFNEPQIFLGVGCGEGKHAPGWHLPPSELLLAGQNILLAHGRAVRALRNNSKNRLNIGIVMAISPPLPSDDKPETAEACKRLYGSASFDNFIFTDAYWLDQIVFGKYPEGMESDRRVPVMTDEERRIISEPIDFIGHNIYWGNSYRLGEGGGPEPAPTKQGAPLTALFWNITPDALYWGAKLCCERYKLPYYITESGMAAHDAVSLDGKVHDPNRIDYINRYLLGLRRAADEGCDVRGYFVWSFLDNFEWSEGYRARFGLVYVDYGTQERIPKDSYYWYKSVIESNGANL